MWAGGAILMRTKVRHGGMRLGSRENVTLRGVAWERGSWRCGTWRWGSVLSFVSRCDMGRTGELKEGSLLRQAPSLESFRPTRYVPLHSGGEGLLVAFARESVPCFAHRAVTRATGGGVQVRLSLVTSPR